MAGNHYIKSENRERDKMLEFLVVIVVVGVLIFFGINYYTRPIAGSQKSIIEYHAGIFSRMTATLQAMGRATSGDFVTLSGVTFYLNENGWPANTDAERSPSVLTQTAEECRQLWEAVFTNAPSSRVIGKPYKKNVDYIVSLNKNAICRYEIARKQEGSYFFDYDVSNGAVRVVRPEAR